MFRVLSDCFTAKGLKQLEGLAAVSHNLFLEWMDRNKMSLNSYIEKFLNSKEYPILQEILFLFKKINTLFRSVCFFSSLSVSEGLYNCKTKTI